MRWVTGSLSSKALRTGVYNLTLVQTTAEGQEATLPEPVTVTVGAEQAPAGSVAAGDAARRWVGGGARCAGGAKEGTAIPGATVAVFDGLNKLGEAIADALGTWKLELQGLAPGAYSLTLRQTTAEGQEIEQPEPVVVTVGGVTQPEVALPEGGLAAAAGEPVVLEGVAVPGATVAVFDGINKLGEVIADALGKWRLELRGLAPGAYDLTLVQTTAEGVETTLPEPVAVTVSESAPATAPEVVAPEVTLPEGGLAVAAVSRQWSWKERQFRARR